MHCPKCESFNIKTASVNNVTKKYALFNHCVNYKRCLDCKHNFSVIQIEQEEFKKLLQQKESTVDHFIDRLIIALKKMKTT